MEFVCWDAIMGQCFSSFLGIRGGEASLGYPRVMAVVPATLLALTACRGGAVCRIFSTAYESDTLIDNLYGQPGKFALPAQLGRVACGKLSWPSSGFASRSFGGYHFVVAAREGWLETGYG